MMVRSLFLDCEAKTADLCLGVGAERRTRKRLIITKKVIRVRENETNSAGLLESEPSVSSPAERLLPELAIGVRKQEKIGKCWVFWIRGRPAFITEGSPMGSMKARDLKGDLTERPLKGWNGFIREKDVGQFQKKYLYLEIEGACINTKNW